MKEKFPKPENIGSAIDKAFEILGGVSGEENSEDWKKAKFILDNFNVPKLGEKFARNILFDVVIHVHFPDVQTTTHYVGQAEGLLGELLDVDADRELHMAEIEVLANEVSDDEDIERTRQRFIRN